MDYAPRRIAAPIENGLEGECDLDAGHRAGAVHSSVLTVVVGLRHAVYSPPSVSVELCKGETLTIRNHGRLKLVLSGSQSTLSEQFLTNCANKQMSLLKAIRPIRAIWSLSRRRSCRKKAFFAS